MHLLFENMIISKRFEVKRILEKNIYISTTYNEIVGRRFKAKTNSTPETMVWFSWVVSLYQRPCKSLLEDVRFCEIILNRFWEVDNPMLWIQCKHSGRHHVLIKFIIFEEKMHTVITSNLRYTKTQIFLYVQIKKKNVFWKQTFVYVATLFLHYAL